MFSYKDISNHTWLLTKLLPCIMGCTSSASNMAAPNPNATEKNTESSEEPEQSISEDGDIIAAEQEENGKNEIKVLPSCDTLADPIQLDSNNKSLNTSNLDLDKDLLIKEHVTEIENVAKEVSSSEEKKPEDKLSSLDNIVEKVVELFVTEKLISSSEVVTEQTDQIDINKVKVNEENELPVEHQEPDEDSEEQEKPPEEVASPSQSTSSRATRWEALADIAAELPPSLTVDPLTGQIYALSK